MSVEDIPIVIVESPGKLREGLCSLIESQPFVQLIGTVEDETSLFQQIKMLSKACIILFDMDLFGKNSLNICRKMIKEAPQTGCILLVNTFSQKKQAVSAGLNNVLIKGFSANDLFMMIQHIQSEKPGNSKVKNNHPIKNKKQVIGI
jgi:DNA-binding NarL/FixJ family response regulator